VVTGVTLAGEAGDMRAPVWSGVFFAGVIALGLCWPTRCVLTYIVLYFIVTYTTGLPQLKIKYLTR